jgi:hypothetical protein
MVNASTSVSSGIASPHVVYKVYALFQAASIEFALPDAAVSKPKHPS